MLCSSARGLCPWLLCVTVGISGCVRWGVDDDDASLSQGTESSTSTSTTSSTTSSTTEAASTGGEGAVWPEPWPIDPSARVVAWGRTGIPTRNLALFENFILALASDGGGGATTGGTGGTGTAGTAGASTAPSGSTSTTTIGGGTGSDTDSTGTGGEEPGAMSMLWIADCDPRTDEVGCLAGNVTPFFEAVERLGTIDFLPLSAVDARAYDVVVADFCGPVDPQQVAQLLGDGARVLVLGDRWCVSETGVSADVANVLLERIGARFTLIELYNHDLRVPGDLDTLLDRVETIDAWGVTLQETNDDFEAVLVTADGAVITRRG